MKKILIVLIACIAAFFSLGRLWTEAAPRLPASFYGTITVNGVNVPAYASVEALIGGVTYATVPVQTSGGATVYAIDVPGDIPEQAGKQGGETGDIIQFKVAGLICAQTGVWSDGLRQNLNLTASGNLPTLTPTPSLSPTSTRTITPTPSKTPSVTSTPAIVEVQPARDTFISEWEPNTNYGSDQRLKVRSSPYRSLLYFDTAFIPSNATVRSAKLYLYLDWYTHLADKTATVSVYKVQTDWAESQATWNQRVSGTPWSAVGCNGSADRLLTAAGSAGVLDVSTWYEWDITSLVQDWVWSPTGNKGMILISDIGRELRFHSMNMSNNRPYLRIDYVTGVGPGPTATTTPTAGATPSVEPTVEFEEFRNASQDTYIYNSEANTTHENIGLRITGLGYKKSLLNFDVSKIPQGSQIISATLRLTASNYDDGRGDRAIDVGAYLVNRRWIANQATWNAARSDAPWGVAGCNAIPGDRLGAPASVTRVQEISTGTLAWQRVLYDWDVTSIVQAWVNDPVNQAGLILQSESAMFRDVGFWDSAYQGEAGRDLHPVLYVQWRSGGPTLTPTLHPSITPTGTPVLGTGSIIGTVYHDANGNGIREGGEFGLLNFQVQLKQGDVVLREEATSGDGHYGFNNVLAGVYQVQVVPQSQYLSTTQNPRTVTLGGGQSPTIDFGVKQGGTTIHLPMVTHYYDW